MPKTLQDYIRANFAELEFKNIYIGQWDWFAEQVAEQTTSVGEEALHREYENYGNDWQLEHLYADYTLKYKVWVWLR